MTSKYERAANARLEIFRVVTEPSYADYIAQMHHNDFDFTTRDFNPIDAAQGFADGLNEAKVYYVPDEMTDVLLVAAKQIPEFRIDPWDIPAQYGLAYFEKPLPIYDWAVRDLIPELSDYDPHKDPYPLLRAAQWWAPEGEDVAMVFYGQLSDNIDFYKWTIAAVDAKANDLEGTIERIEGAEPIIRRLVPRWASIDMSKIALGKETTITSEQGREKNLHFLALVSLWMMITQESVTEAVEDEPRASRKRNKREGITKSEEKIRVVYLPGMRYSHGGKRHTDEEATESYLHSRFLVSGHWRRQWYPSLQTHKPKWINPYVKGPEDAPFVAKETVNVVRERK